MQLQTACFFFFSTFEVANSTIPYLDSVLFALHTVDIAFIKLCKKIWILHGDCDLEMIFSINTLMFSITAAHHFCVTCLSEKVIHMVRTISKSP